MKTQPKVDDIICHLDGSIAAALCQERFEGCADIVIPPSIQIPLVDPEAVKDEDDGSAATVPPSDLSPFLFLVSDPSISEIIRRFSPLREYSQ